MKDIKSISKEFWSIIVRLYFLLFQLGRQIVLPNRKRKGNLLTTVFLLYIGVIENIQHFEHRQFKLADVFQNRLVRKGFLLFSFLLFFLTSYEQPAFTPSPISESSKVQCSYQKEDKESAYDCVIKAVCIKDEFLPIPVGQNESGSYSSPPRIPTKLYLQNRRFNI